MKGFTQHWPLIYVRLAPSQTVLTTPRRLKLELQGSHPVRLDEVAAVRQSYWILDRRRSFTALLQVLSTFGPVQYTSIEPPFEFPNFVLYLVLNRNSSETRFPQTTKLQWAYNRRSLRLLSQVYSPQVSPLLPLLTVRNYTQSYLLYKHWL